MVGWGSTEARKDERSSVSEGPKAVTVSLAALDFFLFANRARLVLSVPSTAGVNGAILDDTGIATRAPSLTTNCALRHCLW